MSRTRSHLPNATTLFLHWEVTLQQSGRIVNQNSPIQFHAMCTQNCQLLGDVSNFHRIQDCQVHKLGVT